MKKQVLLVLLFCITALPLPAAMNFYRAEDGNLVLEVTDCNSAARLMDLVGLPDDPPPSETDDNVPDDEPGNLPDDEQTTPQPDTPTIPADPNGVQTLLQAVFGKEEETQTKISHGISTAVEEFLNTASFDERQDAFITFVRDVNWKTGLYITFRDYSFFRRLRMACSGINQLTRPMRVNLEAYTGDLSQTIESISDAGVDKLAQAARGHSFDALSKLSVLGVAIAVEKENPFLLLAIDEETYNKLIETEPRIKQLFEDMYTFFSIRAIRMGGYNSNIKALIDIVKIGKGDAFDTWHIMAQYAKNLLELDRQGKLTVSDEKDIHLWRLEGAMHYIKEQVRIERRAAELAANDPQHAALMKEIESGPKKKESLDYKAQELLRKSTQAEIKHLIQKYVTK